MCIYVYIYVCVCVYIYLYTHTYTYVYIYIPAPLSLPHFPQHTHLGHHRMPGWAPCVILQLPTIYFTHNSVYMLIILSQFICPSPSPAVSTKSVLCSVHQYHFLDSICMC